MSAETIARGLHGRKVGRGYVAPCPAQQEDKHPSLSLRDSDDGKVLVHCFAGCSQGAVISALRARGLWPEPLRATLTPERRRARVRERAADRRDLPKARHFGRAVIALCEECLDSLAWNHPQRAGVTQLLRAARVDSSLLVEFREWRRKHRRLTAALVEADRESEQRAVQALLELTA